MSARPQGLHHVTAVAADPQANVDFYAGVLGMRLVKQTVNFDAPDVYHLYFGDQQGSPGTLVTFFPWPGAPRGRHGAGQATVIGLSVGQGSLGWWAERLAAMGVEHRGPVERDGEEALRLRDPDGLELELVATAEVADVPAVPWAGGPVPAAHQVHRVHAVELTERDLEPTVGMLTGSLGFRVAGEQGRRVRLDVGDGGSGARVEVVASPDGPAGLVAAGTVHHVAWRAPDRDEQAAWRGELVDHGLNVTPVIDRQYFESIYFREPGGVLLEVATDPPGMTADEPLLELGRRLRLPPWLEPDREAIEQALPQLRLPDPEQWAAGAPQAGGADDVPPGA